MKLHFEPDLEYQLQAVEAVPVIFYFQFLQQHGIANMSILSAHKAHKKQEVESKYRRSLTGLWATPAWGVYE